MRRHTFRLTPADSVLGAVIVLLLSRAGLPACLRAADPPAAVTAGKPDRSVDDLKLTGLARKALYQDKRLAGLNTGVTVQQGVATLWGRLTSADVAQQALDRLRQVPGIVRVVDTTKIVPPADPLMTQVVEALREQGVQPESPVAPATVTTAKVTGNKSEWEPRPEPEPRWVAGSVPTRTTVLRPAGGPAPAVLSKPEPIPDTSTDLDATWDRLRKKDTRFQAVVLESHAGMVRISGSVARLADAWELADLLAELPGVKQVVVGQVEVK